jgi:hypothetical protein
MTSWKSFCFLFLFYLPCGVSVTQHCLTFHTAHLPSPLRFTGKACGFCVIHCGHFPACQKKWYPYSVDCLSELKVSVFAERPSAFFGRFVQYKQRNISPASYRYNCSHCSCMRRWHIIKGKAVPLQAWSGPEVSRKLRLPDFMTTAQDVGKVVSRTHRPPLPPGNTPGTHFC